MALIPLSPSRLTPAAPSERGRLFAREKRGGNVQHSCGASTCAAPPQDKRTHARRKPGAQPNPKRHSQPKSAPAAKAAAAAPGRIAAHTRDTGQAPSRNPSGTATPNAHRRRSRRSSIWQDSRTHARQQPMHPAETQAAQPAQKRTGGKAAAAAPGRSIAPAQDKGQAPTPNPSGTANPKAHRRPKPPQLHPAGYTHQRETQAKHPAEPQAAQPTQKRTGGTAAAAVPGGTTRQREIKGPDVRIRQNKPHPTRISGPRQPAPGSGEPRKRLKLRSAMHNYVSCLGMTTQKVSASVRFHRTQRRQKSAFLWGYPRFFWQDKRNGVQRAQWP